MNPEEILFRIPAPVKGSFQPSWNSLSGYKVPKWFTDSRFGIFIHWGVYSVPAFSNEWYPRNMYDPSRPEYKYHLKSFGPHTEFGYKDFIPMFTAENWDPDEWARIFERAGAKFVVLVAEHHDGFALWDSSYTRWCAARIGPKRDIVKELKIAVENRGLIFGVSYHRAEHWWFFNTGMMIESDVRDPKYFDLYGPAKPASLDPRAPQSPENIPPDHSFLMDWLLRIVEVVERYRPWIVYFDWWIANPAFEPYLKAFAAYYYNRCYSWGIEPVIVYKHGAFQKGTAVPDLAERGTVATIQEYPWLADTSVDYKSWGYIKDAEYKTPESIIQHMVDVVSKNGVFLLNIGPKPDGTIPDEQKRILLNIGDWLAIYGEAIYGSKPWKVFGEWPTRVEEGFFTEKKIVFTDKDIRYTSKYAYPLKEIVYAVAMGRPAGEITLRSLRDLGGRIINIDVPNSKETVEWDMTDEGVKIRIPNSERLRRPIVLRIIID